VQAQQDVVASLHVLVDSLGEAISASQIASATSPDFGVPLLLSAAEAGKLLSVSRSKVLDLAGRGQIPCIRIGGSVRIPRDRLIAWIDDRTMYAVGRPVPHVPAWAHINRSEEV